jgi:hypothetical protein
MKLSAGRLSLARRATSCCVSRCRRRPGLWFNHLALRPADLEATRGTGRTVRTLGRVFVKKVSRGPWIVTGSRRKTKDFPFSLSRISANRVFLVRQV